MSIGVGAAEPRAEAPAEAAESTMAVRRPFKSVAVVIPEGGGAFGLGVVSEVFGFDRQPRGLPGFDFAVCSPQPGTVRLDSGMSVVIEHGLDRVVAADLVHVLSWQDFERPAPPALLDAVRAAHDRGAIVASHCTGAYVLAAAGLLDGKRATTHWRWAADLAGRFPAVKFDPDVLYVDEGQIVTGAGTAAGVDLCLYLLRREYGAAIAAAIARDMVVPPYRDGGQAQFVTMPVPPDSADEQLAEVLNWALGHLDQPLTVDSLAAHALTSPRSFARHFRAATGTTPHAWLLAQRLHRAEELLETTDVPVEEIARMVGFGSAAALREQFVRRRGVSPRDYRRAFGTSRLASGVT
jgi:transcriptional regulator GlxA family with amidase domain